MIDVEKEMQEETITASAQFVNRMVELANVQAVFGQPVECGETILIPCCEVSVTGGIGMGSGPSAGGEQRKVSIAQGAGGGGGATGRPIAVIVLSPQGVRVQPIMDMTKVVLAAFATAVFLLSWLGRLSRAARSGKEKEPSFAQLKKAFEG
jgi:uncharacterized spore protein YtfJ